MKKNKKDKSKSGLVIKNGFPLPKKVECFECGKEFLVKFVQPRQEYSHKNDWEYWTGEKGKKYICDEHLLGLYYNKPVYWKTITDLRKRQQIRTYIYHGIIAKSEV